MDNKKHRMELQEKAIAAMVASGEAELRTVCLGGKTKKLYKIKPYVPED